jgi:hypothetical protein
LTILLVVVAMGKLWVNDVLLLDLLIFHAVSRKSPTKLVAAGSLGVQSG